MIVVVQQPQVVRMINCEFMTALFYHFWEIFLHELGNVHFLGLGTLATSAIPATANTGINQVKE